MGPRSVVSVFSWWLKSSQWISSLIAEKIFGKSTTQNLARYAENDENEGEDEWTGRVNYMQKMNEKAMDRIKKEIVNELRSLESRFDEKQAFLLERRKK